MTGAPWATAGRRPARRRWRRSPPASPRGAAAADAADGRLDHGVVGSPADEAVGEAAAPRSRAPARGTPRWATPPAAVLEGRERARVDDLDGASPRLEPHPGPGGQERRLGAVDVPQLGVGGADQQPPAGRGASGRPAPGVGEGDGPGRAPGSAATPGGARRARRAARRGRRSRGEPAEGGVNSSDVCSSTTSSVVHPQWSATRARSGRSSGPRRARAGRDRRPAGAQPERSRTARGRRRRGGRSGRPARPPRP